MEVSGMFEKLERNNFWTDEVVGFGFYISIWSTMDPLVKTKNQLSLVCFYQANPA